MSLVMSVVITRWAQELRWNLKLTETDSNVFVWRRTGDCCFCQLSAKIRVNDQYYHLNENEYILLEKLFSANFRHT